VFRKRSALTKALREWLSNEGSLTDHLPDGHNLEVRTSGEASLVCAAIDHARNELTRSGEWQAENNLRSAIAFLQQVGSAEARDALIQHGLPRLRSILRERLAQPDNERLPALFALKIIGLYRQPEDVALFIGAARAPIEPDSFWWTTVFYALDGDNPCTPALIAGLSQLLPPGFIRVVFLDRCNALAFEGRLSEHPFASAEGLEQLERWLNSTNEEQTSYAVSACVAIPFLPPPAQRHLLDLASKCSAAVVRLEAAWVGAKLGVAGGAEQLVEFARNPHYSQQAQRYLEEVGLTDRIPAESCAPDFVALAEMCQWIAHPNEFGRPPDAIEQVETRELYWPPTRDRRRLWIFRYRFDNEEGQPDEGYGLVGSVTWAMFGSNTIDLSPEDVYGLHCAWELIQNEDREAPAESTAAAGRAILTRHNPGFGRPSLQVIAKS
jgi:hypothetical protein